jgi:hypothetical protein
MSMIDKSSVESVEYESMKVPTYSARPTAPELAAASLINAKRRCSPFLALLFKEIDAGVAKGLGYINAKKTLKKLHKCSKQEQTIFIRIINQELSERNIVIDYQPDKMCVVWDTLGLNHLRHKIMPRNIIELSYMGTCQMVVLSKPPCGSYGITFRSVDLGAVVTGSQLAELVVGDIIIEINGHAITSPSDIVSRFQQENVTLKVLRPLLSPSALPSALLKSFGTP